MPNERFRVETEGRLTTLDVTDRVEAALSADVDGIATVFVEHTTCALTLNEAEPRLLEDLETFLGNVVADGGWAHDEIDDNADAHLRAVLVGPAATVPVTDGELAVGTWQSVILVECDGPRRRTVSVTT